MRLILDTLVPKNFCVKTFEYKKFGQDIRDCLGDEKCEHILLKNSSLSYLHVVSKAVKQLTLKAVDDQLMNFRHIANIFHLISSNFHVFRFIREKIK